MQHRTFVELYHTGCSISDASPPIIECGHHTSYAWSEDNSIRYLFVVGVLVRVYLLVLDFRGVRYPTSL